MTCSSSISFHLKLQAMPVIGHARLIEHVAAALMRKCQMGGMSVYFCI